MELRGKKILCEFSLKTLRYKINVFTTARFFPSVFPQYHLNLENKFGFFYISQFIFFFFSQNLKLVVVVEKNNEICKDS